MRQHARGFVIILGAPMPDPNAETPEVIYVTGHTVAEGLRALAERFEADDDLVLIGLWNIEPPEREGYPEAYLQVVVTHLEAALSDSSGGEG